MVTTCKISQKMCGVTNQTGLFIYLQIPFYIYALKQQTLLFILENKIK